MEDMCVLNCVAHLHGIQEATMHTKFSMVYFSTGELSQASLSAPTELGGVLEYERLQN